MLATERLARQEAEARASGVEAMVTHLKLLIAKLKHDRFGASSERGRKLLDQMELELEELETAAAKDNAALDNAAWSGTRAACRAVTLPAASRCAVRCRRICHASGW